jgi:transcription elongation factor GreA
VYDSENYQTPHSLTQSGIGELQQELAERISQRGEIAERIKVAREFGDLSENAEYAAARLEQEQNESRIGEIEHIVTNVEVIDTSKSGILKVQLGSKVTLKSAKGVEKVFQVVGTVEADPASGKISDESPIGKGLMSKKLGDVVEITTPAETASYTVTLIA